MTRRPYCPHCQGGIWIVDPDTGESSKCEHCAPPRTAPVTGPAVAADAHPQALEAAVRIIRDAARARTTFSSNDIRHQLDAAQVHGPVVGAAFSKCARDGMIRHAGDYVASTDPGTHGHPVKVWESQLYGIARRSA